MYNMVYSHQYCIVLTFIGLHCKLWWIIRQKGQSWRPHHFPSLQHPNQNGKRYWVCALGYLLRYCLVLRCSFACDWFHLYLCFVFICYPKCYLGVVFHYVLKDPVKCRCLSKDSSVYRLLWTEMKLHSRLCVKTSTFPSFPRKASTFKRFAGLQSRRRFQSALFHFVFSNLPPPPSYPHLLLHSARWADFDGLGFVFVFLSDYFIRDFVPLRQYSSSKFPSYPPPSPVTP